MLNNKKQKFDLILFLLWPIISTLVSFMFNVNNILSIIVFLGIPCIYLTFRAKTHVMKSIYFTLAVSIMAVLSIDYVAQKSGSWEMYPNSILPFKFFEIVTFEVVLWAFLSFYFIIMFYEHFIHHEFVKKNWNPKMKYLMIIATLLMVIFLIHYSLSPETLNIPYFYLIWGTILLFMPFILQLFYYPKTTQKMFFVMAYFFYFNFIYEITALKLGWWTFPGKHFIGYVSLFGVSFPLEELFFWMILLASSVLSYYEYFDEDEE